MKVVGEHPPGFADIVTAFPKAGTPGVIFAWEDTIYNPSGGFLTWDLIAHEMAHGKRQLACGGAPNWWSRYIAEPEFRYGEELIGHAAELLELARGVTDRNRIAQLFTRTAMRLTAPLYNYQPPRTVRQAVLDLRRELNA